MSEESSPYIPFFNALKSKQSNLILFFVFSKDFYLFACLLHLRINDSYLFSIAIKALLLIFLLEVYTLWYRGEDFFAVFFYFFFFGVIMRRLSFKVTNGEEEIFGGEKGGLYLSRLSFSSKGRRSFCRSSSALSIVNSRNSFSYDKLAQAPIHLTVVKLDGTRFAIEVIKMATVSDLKQAVESAFSHLPTKGPGKVSWRHVWTQFCLSYCDQKLLNDTEHIKNYGVKDGDELRFVRHVSIAYNLIKKRSTKQIEAPNPYTAAENQEEEKKIVEEANDLEKLNNQLEVSSTRRNEPTTSCLIKGWFLYSKLSTSEQLKLEVQPNQPRWPGGFVGCLRSLFRFCNKRQPIHSSKVSQVEIEQLTCTV